jgi:hypothetical protein
MFSDVKKTSPAGVAMVVHRWPAAWYHFLQTIETQVGESPLMEDRRGNTGHNSVHLYQNLV